MPHFHHRCVAALAALAFGPAQAVGVLGSAQDFAVMAHETVTNAHVPGNTSTQVFGDLGTTPGIAITGFFPDGVVSGGVLHANDAVAQLALNAATQAYASLAALPVNFEVTGQVLGIGGLAVLTPGVYRFAVEAQLNGNLVLDFQGTPEARFVFQVGSTLTTSSHSSVTVLNAGPSSQLFWQVGSSATLGEGSLMMGNVLAQASVSFDPTAQLMCGRAFGLTGAVTMIDNLVSRDCSAQAFGTGLGDGGSLGFSGGGAAVVPEPSAWKLMVLALVGGLVLRSVVRATQRFAADGVSQPKRLAVQG